MTLKEQLYRFENLDNHSAIIMQMSIENRRENIILASGGTEVKDKETRATIAELDQMYDDLDRHLAAGIRRQEFEQMAKNHPGG